MHECLMGVGAALEAHAETAERMHPCMRALDYQSDLAQARCRAVVCGRSWWECGRRAVNSGTCRGRSSVGIDALWGLQPSGAPTANRRNSLDERCQLCDVVAVGAGQNDRDRRAVRVGPKASRLRWGQQGFDEFPQFVINNWLSHLLIRVVTAGEVNRFAEKLTASSRLFLKQVFNVTISIQNS